MMRRMLGLSTPALSQGALSLGKINRSLQQVACCTCKCSAAVTFRCKAPPQHDGVWDVAWVCRQVYRESPARRVRWREGLHPCLAGDEVLLNCMLGEARRHVIFPSSTRHPHGIYTMLHCSFVTSAVECSALRLQVVLEFENRPPFKRLPRNCFDDSETVHLSRMFCLLVSGTCKYTCTCTKTWLKLLT